MSHYHYICYPLGVMKRRDISANGKIIYGAMFDSLYKDWPAPEQVAEAVGAPVPVVKRAIRELARHGLVNLKEPRPYSFGPWCEAPN